PYQLAPQVPNFDSGTQLGGRRGALVGRALAVAIGDAAAADSSVIDAPSVPACKALLRGRTEGTATRSIEVARVRLEDRQRRIDLDVILPDPHGGEGKKAVLAVAAAHIEAYRPLRRSVEDHVDDATEV